MDSTPDRDCEFVCSRHAFERAKLRLRNEFFAGRLDTWEMMDDYLCRVAHEAVSSGQFVGDGGYRFVYARGLKIGVGRTGTKVTITTCASVTTPTARSRVGM